MDQQLQDKEAAAGAPPQTLARLLEIWQRILRTPEVAPDSDFFELGGDSLMAVGMLLEVEQATGIALPVTTIYDAPTPAQLAQTIDAHTNESATLTAFSPLVKLKDGDGKTPLFIVHGIGGTVIELAQLGKLVESGNPVYAVQARGLDGREEPFRSVAEMADYYVAAIRTLQPEGPYFLSGYSFGGLIAVEIARRLKADGAAIGLLLLIDAYAHPKTWPLRARLAVLARRASDRLRRQFRISEPAAAAAPPTEAETEIARRGVRRWLRQVLVGMPPELQRVCLAGEEALDSFVPRFYPGPVTFVRARIPSGVFPTNPKPIWKPLSTRLEVHSIAGDHLSVLRADVAVTAAVISACIRRACEARPAGRSFFPRLRRNETASVLEARPC